MLPASNRRDINTPTSELSACAMRIYLLTNSVFACRHVYMIRVTTLLCRVVPRAVIGGGAHKYPIYRNYSCIARNGDRKSNNTAVVSGVKWWHSVGGHVRDTVKRTRTCVYMYVRACVHV